MSRNMNVTSILSLASIALLVGACSNSSGGGGGGAAKPDLKPIAKVGKSFAIVQNAGKSKNPSGSARAIEQTQLQNVNLSSTEPDEEKLKTQALQQLMAKPGACLVNFSQKDGASNPPHSQPQNLGFTLSIKGNQCPVNADFTMDSKLNPLGSNSMDISYYFKVTDAQAVKVVGASEAKVTGSVLGGIDQSGTPFAKGDITGFIDTADLGRVEIAFRLRSDLKTLPGGHIKGAVTEETSFKSPTPNLNIGLVKVTAVDDDKSTINYSANGIAITKEEYEAVSKAWGMSDSGKETGGDQNPTPDQPTPVQPGQPIPGQPGNPGNPGSPGLPGEDQSLWQWIGKIVSLQVNDVKALSKITAKGEHFDFVISKSGLLANPAARGIDESIIANLRLSGPVCVVVGSFTSGPQVVTGYDSTGNPSLVYVNTISFGDHKAIQCFSRDNGLDYASQLQEVFGSVVTFALQQ